MWREFHDSTGSQWHGAVVRRPDPNMPLLWYLRDILGLTGTKFGCGVGLCGACTVHKNGQAVRACIYAVEFRGRSTNHDHRRALGTQGFILSKKHWMQVNVPQCGYCQPGQMMQAIALLAGTPKPTDEQIDDGMAANILSAVERTSASELPIKVAARSTHEFHHKC